MRPLPESTICQMTTTVGPLSGLDGGKHAFYQPHGITALRVYHQTATNVMKKLHSRSLHVAVNCQKVSQITKGSSNRNKTKVTLNHMGHCHTVLLRKGCHFQNLLSAHTSMRKRWSSFFCKYAAQVRTHEKHFQHAQMQPLNRCLRGFRQRQKGRYELQGGTPAARFLCHSQ